MSASEGYAHPWARLRENRRGWYAAGLSDAQVKVLEAVYLRQPDDNASTSVGLEVLAIDLDRSRGSVQEVVTQLERAGWILATPARQGRLWRLAVLADSPDAAATTAVETARADPRTHPRSLRGLPAQSARIVRARRDSLRDSLRDSAAPADEAPPDFEAMRRELRGLPPADDGE